MTNCNYYKFMKKTTIHSRFKIRWLNTQALILIFLGLFLPVFNGQAQTYCSPTFTSSNCCEYITNVTFQGSSLPGINNSTGMGPGGSNPVIDYTTQTASVIQGLTYPISIGFQYGGIGLYFDVFIDWDNNGTLTDPGEVYNMGGPFSSGPVTGNIVVPINAVPGTTRMRVVMRTGTSFTMCNTTNGGYGEVEDYSIIVIANTPCSGTPTAGTAAVNTRACSSEPVNLTLTGSTL